VVLVVGVVAAVMVGLDVRSNSVGEREQGLIADRFGPNDVDEFPPDTDRCDLNADGVVDAYEPDRGPTATRLSRPSRGPRPGRRRRTLGLRRAPRHRPLQSCR
jgi:hypothetical protein